ncbi:hypothetical protein OF83DRAFT_1110454 [Amylostereum chailletii]|nr:hypothetical protein OF83DRAFT_1110454 [Amylostereum chailletii]
MILLSTLLVVQVTACSLEASKKFSRQGYSPGPTYVYTICQFLADYMVNIDHSRRGSIRVGIEQVVGYTGSPIATKSHD